jgi:hypothetical protein
MKQGKPQEAISILEQGLALAGKIKYSSPSTKLCFVDSQLHGGNGRKLRSLP